ncbi:MAG: hypothetical protein QOH16_714 [Gaiellaceae bacterium]|nr:hypothetical protein [Gaiellaceae bacterium]
MRTELSGTCEILGIGHLGQDCSAIELVTHAPDWEIVEDPGFRPTDLRTLFHQIEATAQRRHRRLPTHREDPLIRDAVNAEPSYQERADFPLIAANALVIIAQLEPADRTEALAAPYIGVAVHHRWRAYAVIFGSGQRGRVFRIRIRSDARPELTLATESMAAALITRQPYSVEQQSGGRHVGIGQVDTSFDRANMYDVHGAQVTTGSVIAIGAAPTIVKRAFLGAAPRILGLVGLVLSAASAVFFWLSHGHHNVYTWFDGFAGRLATAFFGAALIAGTERALSLRAKLQRSGANVAYGAVIDWDDSGVAAPASF